MNKDNSIFFNYDDLTWDEVANLPRDTPLVLPLGSGYDHAQLLEQLSGPGRCGLLPAFPFGWRNSGLEIQYSWTSTPVTTPSYKLSPYTFCFTPTSKMPSHKWGQNDFLNLL